MTLKNPGQAGVLFFIAIALYMEQTVAIRLLEKGIEKTSRAVWADLGAGSGVFTKALATLLGESNMVYAVDKDEAALQFNLHRDLLNVKTITADFNKDELNLPPLDGILMANSLHYIKSKLSFVTKLKTMLKPQGRLVIVEYDTLAANTWVPYPIDFKSLTKLMSEAGFSSVIKLDEEPSRFRHGSIYSALVQ